MEKKLYRYRKDSDVWMEARIPLEYASCHDGIVVVCRHSICGIPEGKGTKIIYRIIIAQDAVFVKV